MSEFLFEEGEIDGFLTVTGTSFKDHRGSFSRLYSRSVFNQSSSFVSVEHINLSVNPARHTLRGFHYSLTDANEVKIFKCITGAIFNVTIDVRKDSPTFGRKKIVELVSTESTSIIVPAGCANAWITMEKDTRILYLVAAEYDFTKERGFRFDDPKFAIDWPAYPKQISSKDLAWKPYES